MIPYRKQALALKTRRGRQSQGRFLIEGVRLVEEALSAGLAIERVYHTPPPEDGRAAGLLKAAGERGAPLAEVTEEELLTLADTESPQGLVAVAQGPGFSADEVWGGGNGDLLVLDNVRDPGNAGTLMRTAASAGARGVVQELPPLVHLRGSGLHDLRP